MSADDWRFPELPDDQDDDFEDEDEDDFDDEDDPYSDDDLDDDFEDEDEWEDEDDDWDEEDDEEDGSVIEPSCRVAQLVVPALFMRHGCGFDSHPGSCRVAIMQKLEPITQEELGEYAERAQALGGVRTHSTLRSGCQRTGGDAAAAGRHQP